MDNNSTSRETKITELSKPQTSLRWRHKQTWLAALGFWSLALSLSSIFTSIQKFPNDSFVVNWLPWVIVLFFALGWLLTHWLEVVAFKKQKGIVIFLISTLVFGSLFFCFYFELFASHPVLSRLGLPFAYLILSGSCLRVSVFRDEGFSFLQETHPLVSKYRKGSIQK